MNDGWGVPAWASHHVGNAYSHMRGFEGGAGSPLRQRPSMNAHHGMEQRGQVALGQGGGSMGGYAAPGAEYLRFGPMQQLMPQRIPVMRDGVMHAHAEGVGPHYDDGRGRHAERGRRRSSSPQRRRSGSSPRRRDDGKRYGDDESADSRLGKSFLVSEANACIHTFPQCIIFRVGPAWWFFA